MPFSIDLKPTNDYRLFSLTIGLPTSTNIKDRLNHNVGFESYSPK